MGWFSNLFRRTVELEYRDEHGKQVKKTVSKRQFDALMKNAIAEGKATVRDACLVHILDAQYDSECSERWIIGEQIPRRLASAAPGPPSMRELLQRVKR